MAEPVDAEAQIAEAIRSFVAQTFFAMASQHERDDWPAYFAAQRNYLDVMRERYAIDVFSAMSMLLSCSMGTFVALVNEYGDDSRTTEQMISAMLMHERMAGEAIEDGLRP